MKFKNLSFTVFVFSLCFCSGGGVKALDGMHVDFKIVCKGQSPDCSKAILKNTGKEIYIKNQPLLTLMDITAAKPSGNAYSKMRMKSSANDADAKALQENYYGVLLTFKNPEALKAATAAHIGERMAIVIDGTVVRAPYIHVPVTGGVLEVGYMTEQKAQTLADEINKALNH